MILTEFVKVNKILIEDMLGLKSGDEMLILTSAEVPYDIAESAQIYAESKGIKSYILNVPPRPKEAPPSKAISSIAKEVDGIYLLSGWDSLDFKEEAWKIADAFTEAKTVRIILNKEQII